MLSKSYIALIVIILAITASLEALPKYIVFEGISLPGSSSPLSSNPYGTSYLLNVIRSVGYNAEIVGTPDDLDYIRAKKVLIMIISPIYISDNDILSLLNSMRRFNNVSILIADEAPGISRSYKLSAMISQRYCGNYIVYPEPTVEPQYPTALAVISLPDSKEMYSLLTGYVTNVRALKAGIRDEDLLSNYKELMRLPVSIVSEEFIDLKLLGVVSGVTKSGNLSDWFPLAIACNNRLAGLRMIVIGDGSIFINEALNRSETYRRASISLIDYLTRGDRDFKVIMISDFYVPQSLRLKYRFLPSLFLTWAVKAYKNIERFLYSMLYSKAPVLVILLALAFSLLPLSFIPHELREVEKSREVKAKRLSLDELCKRLRLWLVLEKETVSRLGLDDEIKSILRYCKLLEQRQLRPLLKLLGIEGYLKKRILRGLRRLYVDIDKEV